MFNILIIGGGAAGLSCALVLGSAQNKPFAKNKHVAIIMHQKTSHLQSALLNNVLGIEAGTKGRSILENGRKQLRDLYPHVAQIENEKVAVISKATNAFIIETNKNTYKAKCVVVAVGYTSLLNIEGLDKYIEPHPRATGAKNRIWLKNNNHVIEDNLYVAGTLAGWRSQFAIASGSGAHVATDILTLWNDGEDVNVHDK